MASAIEHSGQDVDNTTALKVVKCRENQGSMEDHANYHLLECPREAVHKQWIVNQRHVQYGEMAQRDEWETAYESEWRGGEREEIGGGGRICV